jgi:FkbM family methyltransferase
VELFGYTADLDLSDNIQRDVYLGAFERSTTAAVRKMLRAGDTFLDVGANMGYFTLLAARLVGATGRVVAVEPSPWVANRLRSTLSRNAISQATLYEVGLSDQQGHLLLPVPPPGNHTPSLFDVRTDRPKVRIEVVTLDEAIDAWFGATPVSLMKVDIEGAELGLLRGGQQILRAGRIQRVLIEENDEWLGKAGGSVAVLRGLLEAAGFVSEGRLAGDMALWRHRSVATSDA